MNPRSSYRSLSGLLAVASMALLGGGAAVTGTNTGRTSSNQANVSEAERVSPRTANAASPTFPITPASNAGSFWDRLFSKGGHRFAPRPSYPNGPGWTHAVVKRMARKKRNVKANRKSHR